MNDAEIAKYMEAMTEAEIVQYIKEVSCELIKSPRGTTIGDVIRRGAANGDPRAIVMLRAKFPTPGFLDSTLLSFEERHRGHSVEENDRMKIALEVKGKLMLNPPPMEPLLNEIAECLEEYPQSAEGLMIIDGRQIFYIYGPWLEGGALKVDVWERDEIEEVYRRAGKTFFQGRATRQ